VLLFLLAGLTFVAAWVASAFASAESGPIYSCALGVVAAVLLAGGCVIEAITDLKYRVIAKLEEHARRTLHGAQQPHQPPAAPAEGNSPTASLPNAGSAQSTGDADEPRRHHTHIVPCPMCLSDITVQPNDRVVRCRSCGKAFRARRRQRAPEEALTR
jgi:hypothetical protein